MSPLGKAAAERRERLGEAVTTVERVLFRLARQGLSRASPTTVSELQALAQTAHAAGMVRCERDLAALATTVRHYLDRDPNFRERRYTDRLTRVLLRNAAARGVFDEGGDPRDAREALGEARRTYVPADRVLHVQALGAAGWVTDSDFVGITVHLRCEGRVLTLANARPVAYFGNEPRRLFRQPFSDRIDVSVEELAHGAHTLEGARLASDGRLSLSPEGAVRPAAWTARAWEGRVAERWSEAVGVLRTLCRDPLDGGASALLMLRPFGWGPVRVDEIQGAAHATLRDDRDAVVRIQVPLRPENNLLIDNLITLGRRPDLRPDGLFGRLAATARGLVFEPMTAIYDRPVTLSGRGRVKRRDVDEVHLGLEDVERVQR